MISSPSPTVLRNLSDISWISVYGTLAPTMDPVDDPLILSSFSSHLQSQSLSQSTPTAAPLTPATPATRVGPGPIRPAEVLDSEDHLGLSGTNPLLSISNNTPMTPVNPATATTVTAAATELQRDISPLDLLPSAGYDEFDYDSVFKFPPLDVPTNDLTSPINDGDASLGQLDASSTAKYGPALEIQPMPSLTQPASILRQLRQPRQTTLQQPMHHPMHQHMRQPTQTLMSGSHAQASATQAWAIDEANRGMIESAEMASGFPPEYIPVNYTNGMEAGLSQPLNIPEELEEEDMDEDEGIMEFGPPIANTLITPINGNGPRPLHDSYAVHRRIARRSEIESNRKRRREEHQKRRREMIERRIEFSGLAERDQMYFVQDVRNHCRNSGLGDPENPWFEHDFDAELKGIRNIGKSLSQQLPEPPKQEGAGPETLSLDFLDQEFLSEEFTGAGLEITNESNEPQGDMEDAENEAGNGAAEGSSLISVTISKEAARILKEYEEKEAAAVQDRIYILRAIPQGIFDVRKLGANNPDTFKPWGYLASIREIYQAKLRPCLKYFLYRELDRVQIIALRKNGIVGLADRIESLEWDIRDYMKRDEVASAKNVRMVARDYRTGFIKLPQDGACILYHDGELLGYFAAGKHVSFIHSYLARTVGPIWKEDGNQPNALPEVYLQAFAQMFPHGQPQPNYCVLHGVPVNGQHNHDHSH
ncbi:uncharacterized protein DFL_000184 [Arthrobotrys flagrans]|uniref:Uncharacterized protein n=1 Tax=Arthrobotrys flagrans TaxID=97331 RepID=A0A437AD10_ARTFL|nr:hypothetical protein DFL_000184 [Arthrobotrys flagrans]